MGMLLGGSCETVGDWLRFSFQFSVFSFQLRKEQKVDVDGDTDHEQRATNSVSASTEH
jgi:hypothetical protein